MFNKKITIFLVIINCVLYSHEERVHQYITNEAFKLLKNRFQNYIPFLSTLENHMGNTGDLTDWPIKNLLFQESKVVAANYDEDHWDAMLMRSQSFPPNVVPGVGTVLAAFSSTDPFTSVTHFWRADDGDAVDHTLYGRAGLLSTQFWIYNCENAYKKARWYTEGSTTASGGVKYFIPHDFTYQGVNPLIFNLTTGGMKDFSPEGNTFLGNNGIISVTFSSLASLYNKNAKIFWKIPHLSWEGPVEVILTDEQRNFLIFELLGRICHLLQDMTVPAHAHTDIHGSDDEGIRHDYYEHNYMPQNFTRWNYANVGDVLNPYQWTSGGQNSFLRFLFYTSSQMADWFHTNGPYFIDGNANWGGNPTSDEIRYLNTVTFPTFNNVPSTNEDGLARGNILMPQAIKATAGIMLWFINQLFENKFQYFISIDQTAIDDPISSVDSVGYWKNSQFTFDDAPIHGLNLFADNNNAISGTHAKIGNSKFYKWFPDDNLLNHRTVELDENTPTIYRSQLKEFHHNLIIENKSSDFSGNQYGNIQIKDPWYEDYSDPDFGNTLRNRGMGGSIFHSYSSPFILSQNAVYKGVFLNQGYNPITQVWTPPYYSVKAESPQEVPINNRTHNFYFQNWTGTNANFQNANSLTTGVVFTNDNAVVNANMKGTQLSNQTDAFDNSSQR